MPAMSCPHCGATMNSSLKFCISCGRAISAEDAKKFGGIKSVMKSGVTKRLDDMLSASSFGKAKKSYGGQRFVRQFLLVLSVSILILLAVFVTYKAMAPKDTVPALKANWPAGMMLKYGNGKNEP
jgi:hypothetical protein